MSSWKNHKDQEKIARAVTGQVLRQDPASAHYADNHSLAETTGLIDFLFAFPNEPHTPDEVFARIRWGGLFIFISKDKQEVLSVAQQFHSRRGFVVDQGLSSVRLPRFGMQVWFFGKTFYYFVARKVSLIQPGQTNRRSTFDVQLVREPGLGDGYIVLKQVPSYSGVVQRLTTIFPDTDLDTIAKRARKLVDRVFPVFLTREAAFLNILQRDLGPEFRERVPKVLGVKKDENGMVRKMFVNWLRLGGKPMSQLEFAKQSTDMLRVLHDKVGIIHLDLRLDNIVVTEKGVGFIDFGSAVRDGEDITESPMLQSLFSELMSTSQIQKTLGKMKSMGLVTSHFIGNAYQKVDKAVDMFHLAIQMNKPHTHPDFVGLVDYDAESEEAKRLALLTDAVLRPSDPERPTFISAKHVLHGIKRIEDKLDTTSAEPAMSA